MKAQSKTLDPIIKVLKIIFLIIGILVGLVVLVGGIFFIQEVKSGNLDKYFKAADMKTVMSENAPSAFGELESNDIDQKSGVENGGNTQNAQDTEPQITEEQVNCVIDAVGLERAIEIGETGQPTAQEIIKLAKCL